MADIQHQIAERARPGSRVGDIIQPGEPIPDNVTGVQGAAKSQWRLTSKGHWHLSTAQVTCLHDDCGADGYALMRAGDRALTVTAVREQPASADDPVAYLLWSGRHQAWWAPNACGYTADVERAGRFTRDEAVRYVVTSAQCGIREQVTCMVAAPETWSAPHA